MSESLLLPSAFKLEAPTPCVGGGLSPGALHLRRIWGRGAGLRL